MGWLEPEPTVASYISTSCSLKPLKPTISVTLGLPSVKVPVLYSKRAVSREVFSSVAASLIRILFLAPMPVPTATAVRVARPRASGQAITTAEIAKVRAVSAVTLPKKYQLKKVISPAPIATITSLPAQRSAIL